MNKTRNANLKVFSQSLRKRMTKEERRLWYDCLKGLPVTVNRQKVLGQFIVDFYCATAKLVIELDGSQHFDPKTQKADQERDCFLRGLGLTVLRYTNADINKRFSDVTADVYRHIMQPSTSSVAAATASPQGEAKDTATHEPFPRR